MSLENENQIETFGKDESRLSQEPSSEGDNLSDQILSELNEAGIRLDVDYKDQHLLVSNRAIQHLVEMADITKEDSVLEIGPGPGQITKAIAEKGPARVHAIEFDKRFKPILDKVQSKYPNVQIEYGSALDVKWPEINKLVANPPFSILEPMLDKIAQAKRLQEVVLVIGEKYYQRIIASREISTRTALVTRAFFTPRLIEELKPDDFYPASKEGSVIVSLTRKNKREADFGLQLLASRSIRTPNFSVKGLLMDIINENLTNQTLRNIDYNRIPSVASLSIPQETLRKTLRELDNNDIARLVETIAMLKRKF